MKYTHPKTQTTSPSPFFIIFLILLFWQVPSLLKGQDFVHMESFQSLLDSNDLEGSILIFDPQIGHYFSNDFDWAKVGRLPASTYKIPHSIIALECGVVADSLSLFLWDGQDRYLDVWEQDLTFKQAFQLSCVPCYQEIASKIGVERMNNWLEKLSYGHMQVNAENLTRFWLEGDSRISQFEQINFLYRFYTRKLPISEHSYSTLEDLLLLAEEEDYKLSAKSGWAVRNGHNNGWFVGYLESGARLLFFATNISPRANFSMSLFPVIRSQVSQKALQYLMADPDYDQKYNRAIDR